MWCSVSDLELFPVNFLLLMGSRGGRLINFYPLHEGAAVLALDCSSLGCLYPQPLYSPFSLICTIARTVFIQPPGPSLSSNRWVQTGASQGREGIWRRWKSSQKTMVEPWGRVLDPPQGTRGTVSLSCFADTETPRWVGEVNCILPTSMQTPDVLESEG